MRQLYKVGITVILLGLVLSCGDDVGVGPTGPDPSEPDKSSWEVIQAMFDAQCTSCHTAGSTFALQSGLVLTADVAYENLIDKTPKNAAAANDGLKLLEREGLPSLYNSFLWEKINAPDQEHFYTDHPGYGDIMPPTQSMTNGELEFIREWILKGAPKEGVVASESLLEDTSRFEPDDTFTPLELPESGVQIHLGPFEIQPNYERELFKYHSIGNTEDIYVNRYEITMRKGSHHFLLYDYYPGSDLPQPEVIRDLRDNNGNYNFETLQSLIDQVYVFGTQLRNTDYSYPPGVAKKIEAGKYLDLNSHYTNYNSGTLTGEVYANLHTVPKEEVIHEAKDIFLSKQDFVLPPNQVTTVTSEYRFPEARSIFLLTSHAHQYMEEFRIFISGGPRDGELIYYTNDWEHPILQEYDPPLELGMWEGIRAEAIYNNTTDETLRFGLLSVDEMMIVFGSYY